MTSLFCVAHPDDDALCAGGTIAALARKEKVVLVVFSCGDKFPFWISGEKLAKVRMDELKAAKSILGFQKAIFLGYRDLEVKKVVDEATEKLKKILKELKPGKIFYHDRFDGHPDHRAVNEIINRAVSSLKKKPELYTFEGVWFSLSTKKPVMIFDISKTLGSKIKAMLAFKSQRPILIPLIPVVLLKAIFHGKRHGYKFGEAFYIQ